jgi:excisionase family DNA binding protein
MSDVLPFALPHATVALTPLLVDARELAKLLGAGLRTVRTWDAAGRLPRPVRIGGAVRWHLEEIRAWVEAGAPDRATWEARRAART